MIQPLRRVVKTHLSSTDPTREQEDGWSLDLENRHLQRSCLDKSCFKSYQLMIQPLRMVIKTHLSSTDPTREQEDGSSLDRRMDTYKEVALTKVA